MPTLAELLAAKSAVKSPGTVIRAGDDRARMAAEIKKSLDIGAPKVQPPAPRELGEMERGEVIPMDHPAADAAENEWEWFDSLHSFESELAIVVEPGGEAAWIALQWRNKRPLLLHRLPVVSRPSSGNPF